MSTVMSVHVPGTKVYLTCNDTCHNAKGADCDCLCGGANHGCGLIGVEPVVVPMTIPERFKEHFPADAQESLPFHAKPVKVEREHTAAADASVRTDADPAEVNEDDLVHQTMTGTTLEELEQEREAQDAGEDVPVFDVQALIDAEAARIAAEAEELNNG